MREQWFKQVWNLVLLFMSLRTPDQRYWQMGTQPCSSIFSHSLSLESIMNGRGVAQQNVKPRLQSCSWKDYVIVRPLLMFFLWEFKKMRSKSLGFNYFRRLKVARPLSHAGPPLATQRQGRPWPWPVLSPQHWPRLWRATWRLRAPCHAMPRNGRSRGRRKARWGHVTPVTPWSCRC